MNFVSPDPDRPGQICLNAFWLPLVITMNSTLMGDLTTYLRETVKTPVDIEDDAAFDAIDEKVIQFIVTAMASVVNIAELRVVLQAIKSMSFTSEAERRRIKLEQESAKAIKGRAS